MKAYFKITCEYGYTSETYNFDIIYIEAVLLRNIENLTNNNSWQDYKITKRLNIFQVIFLKLKGNKFYDIYIQGYKTRDKIYHLIYTYGVLKLEKKVDLNEKKSYC